LKQIIIFSQQGEKSNTCVARHAAVGQGANVADWRSKPARHKSAGSMSDAVLGPKTEGKARIASLDTLHG
jgi:hypothetical protein